MQRRRTSGGQRWAEFRAVDIRDRAAVFQAVADVRQRFGSLDGMVCNAVAYPEATPLLDLGPAGLKAAADVMVDGTFHCAQAAARAMVEQQEERTSHTPSAAGGGAAAGMGLQAAAGGVVGGAGMCVDGAAGGTGMDVEGDSLDGVPPAPPMAAMEPAMGQCGAPMQTMMAAATRARPM